MELLGVGAERRNMGRGTRRNHATENRSRQSRTGTRDPFRVEVEDGDLGHGNSSGEFSRSSRENLSSSRPINENGTPREHSDTIRPKEDATTTTRHKSGLRRSQGLQQSGKTPVLEQATLNHFGEKQNGRRGKKDNQRSDEDPH